MLADRQEKMMIIIKLIEMFRKLVIHIGTINILSKEKADTLLSMGFKYTEQKINDNQVVYSFIDTPEIRKVVSCQFAKNEFYISKTVCL